MELIKKFIGILTNLFEKVPEDTYLEEEIATIVFSSINTFYNAVLKYTNENDKDSGNPSFQNNENFSTEQECKVEEKLDYLFQLSDEKNTDMDIHISLESLCEYLNNFLKSLTESKQIYTCPKGIIDNAFSGLTNRKDFPVIVLYAFYQMVFNVLFLELRGERLLFNDELQKYQFSLPYEDQVTFSYFVFRYMFTPEDRERLYNNNFSHKYDCGNNLQGKFNFRDIFILLSTTAEENAQNTREEETKKYINLTELKNALNTILYKIKEKDDIDAKNLKKVNKILNLLYNNCKNHCDNSKNDCIDIDYIINYVEDSLYSDSKMQNSSDNESESITIEKKVHNKVLHYFDKIEGDKSSSFGNFIKELKELNILSNAKHPSSDHSVLKLFYLTYLFKEGRFVNKNVTDNKFSIFKMLEKNDVENFTYDDLPNDTTNGFYSTILFSEIKKDIGFEDVVRLTSYYVKSMSLLANIMETIKTDFRKGSLKIFSKRSAHYSIFMSNFLNTYKSIKIESTYNTISNNVIVPFLALLYLNSIEACLESTKQVNSYLADNEIAILSLGNYGFLEKLKHMPPVYFSEINSTKLMKNVCDTIEKIDKELLPSTNNRNSVMSKIFKNILDIENGAKSHSFNQGNCTFGFFISMVIVSLLTTKKRFSLLPEQKYYRSRTQPKIKTLCHLISDVRNSIFKNSIITCLFEEVNSWLSGKTFDFKHFGIIYEYFDIFYKIIQILKNNPEEGLERLVKISNDCLTGIDQSTLEKTHGLIHYYLN